MSKGTFSHVEAQMLFHMTPDSVLTLRNCYHISDGKLLDANWIH